MNIVVVTRYASDKSEFVHDATEWVLQNPVDRTLYSVGMNGDVRIGPYNIRFVYRPDPLLGCMIVGPRIDIAYYYHFLIEDPMAREIERRMTPGGKKFILLDGFMKEVFRRVKEEQIKAKLNGLFGYRLMSINYPEHFLKLKEESQNKISDVQDILDYNVATVYDTVREGMERAIYDKMALHYQPTEPYKLNAAICIKEEKTMNCDIRSNIKDVIFSDRVTVILWKDGTKTMVRAGKRENYDPEKGFAMAVCKKMFGNEGNYYEVFKKYVPVTHYIVDKKDAKKDIMITDRAVSDEVEKEIVGMIDECQGQNKIWPGLTRRKWKELVNKVAKRVGEKRKREEAEADCKKKKEGIRSGKYPWGVDMSNYMTPPEEGVNSSGKEE